MTFCSADCFFQALPPTSYRIQKIANMYEAQVTGSRSKRTLSNREVPLIVKFLKIHQVIVCDTGTNESGICGEGEAPTIFFFFFFLLYSWKHIEAGAISILSTMKYKVIHPGTQVQILPTE